jgi:hypothetical protein
MVELGEHRRVGQTPRQHGHIDPARLELLVERKAKALDISPGAAVMRHERLAHIGVAATSYLSDQQSFAVLKIVHESHAE